MYTNLTFIAVGLYVLFMGVAIWLAYRAPGACPNCSTHDPSDHVPDCPFDPLRK